MKLIDLICSKSSSQHMRSSSYGGVSGGGLWEHPVVDGLAIYPLLNHQPLTVLPSDNNPHSPPPSEVDSLFRRRHTLEPIITKFFGSLHEAKEVEKGLTEPILRARVGALPKTRTQEPLKHLILHHFHILDSLTHTGNRIEVGNN
jgi:hypothetical protein